VPEEESGGTGMAAWKISFLVWEHSESASKHCLLAGYVRVSADTSYISRCQLAIFVFNGQKTHVRVGRFGPVPKLPVLGESIDMST
jgi:hypothetical protein